MYQIGTDTTMQTKAVRKATLKWKQEPLKSLQKLAIRWFFAQGTGHGVTPTKVALKGKGAEEHSNVL